MHCTEARLTSSVLGAWLIIRDQGGDNNYQGGDPNLR